MKDNETDTIQLGIIGFVVICILAAITTCQKQTTDARLKCFNDGHTLEECRSL